MKVVALAHQKGGPGKTTLSAHLGVAASQAGTVTCFLDFDPQGSLTAWWNAREAEAPALAPARLGTVQKTLADLAAAGMQLVVVDTPPGTGEGVAQLLRHADFLLIPVRPSPNDLRAVGATVELAQAANRSFAFVLNAVRSRSQLAGEAAAILSEHGVVAPPFIGNREDFVKPMADGRTAMEAAPNGKSAAEIRALWVWVAAQLNTSKKPRATRKGA